MILLTLLLLLLASTVLCAASLSLTMLRVAAKKTRRQPADATQPDPTPASASRDNHPKSTRRVPHARHQAAAVAPKRATSPVSSATTPADPKAAALRMPPCADNARDARNLIQQPKRPAGR